MFQDIDRLQYYGKNLVYLKYFYLICTLVSHIVRKCVLDVTFGGYKIKMNIIWMVAYSIQIRLNITFKKALYVGNYIHCTVSEIK